MRGALVLLVVVSVTACGGARSTRRAAAPADATQPETFPPAFDVPLETRGLLTREHLDLMVQPITLSMVTGSPRLAVTSDVVPHPRASEVEHAGEFDAALDATTQVRCVVNAGVLDRAHALDRLVAGVAGNPSVARRRVRVVDPAAGAAFPVLGVTVEYVGAQGEYGVVRAGAFNTADHGVVCVLSAPGYVATFARLLTVLAQGFAPAASSGVERLVYTMRVNQQRVGQLVRTRFVNPQGEYVVLELASVLAVAGDTTQPMDEASLELSARDGALIKMVRSRLVAGALVLQVEVVPNPGGARVRGSAAGVDVDTVLPASLTPDRARRDAILAALGKGKGTAVTFTVLAQDAEGRLGVRRETHTVMDPGARRFTVHADGMDVTTHVDGRGDMTRARVAAVGSSVEFTLDPPRNVTASDARPAAAHGG